MSDKFIITKDKPTADKLISAGFSIISKHGDVYTFLNQPPKNFIFSSIDSRQFCFTNILSM